MILARTHPYMNLQPNQSREAQQLPKQIAQYITAHFKEPISLDSLSHTLGFSRYYISRVFSEMMGQSFPSYLASIRLDYACHLLQHTQLSITSIANEAGFESLRSFFRIFSQKMNITPLQFRIQNNNQTPSSW